MIESIVQSHLSRYPAMQIQDLYKLLHQASMGSEHAESDIESARSWLVNELANLEGKFAEPLIDPISPDGALARIHLRPFLVSGLPAEQLLQSFVRTAREFAGDLHLLESYWEVAVRMGCFPRIEMMDFFQSMKAGNYPALHHSPEYVHAYRPAYRIVSLAFWPD